jgi:predicted acylesterase/phospholipase RssA
MSDTDIVLRARKFLGGERLKFDEANVLWRVLKNADQLALARRVLARLREKPDCLLGSVPNKRDTGDLLCREEALLTSKDLELDATTRHDKALNLLDRRFSLEDDKLTDGEVLGIAGGICKRRWCDLGQLKDLMRAAEFYERGAKGGLGNDGYCQINAAFLEDLLAAAGDRPEERRERARKLRQQIVDELPETGTWWNQASRTEALFGLGRYDEATEVVNRADKPESPWEFRTTAQQLGHLAHLHKERPLETPGVRKFFEALFPGAGDAIRSIIIGKVGLALSGGGFRASYFHLGVLACLAERDVLRDIEVLSCVSGGSIIGACYWLKLRQCLQKYEPITREDYIQLVKELIDHFQRAVRTNLRGETPSKAKVIWRLLEGHQGVLDPEKTAKALDENFYRPLLSSDNPIQMDELKFKAKGGEEFNPSKHNWLRADKVPALILNATTVNTGHAWHFTPTWMGESPWAAHEAADSIPRLEWSTYDANVGWRMELGRAVAASACVPMVFAPLQLGERYKGFNITLVDGGVHDNQGTLSLLASDCNVILVSDACGQLTQEMMPTSGLKGLPSSAKRSIDTLMERVRLANYGHLDSRRQSGLLRGLMFLHMKEGLDADVVRLPFSQETYDVHRERLSPSGVRKDFQQALAELRTDLDVFTLEESCGLMACGYQMTSKALDRDLPNLASFWRGTPCDDWPFMEMLKEITSIENTTARRDEILADLRVGQKVT